MGLDRLSHGCCSQFTWGPDLWGALLTKVNVSPLADVLPRNGMKTFQRQLDVFPKGSSRNEVRAAWWRGSRSNPNNDHKDYC